MGLVSFKSGGGVITSGYKPSSITNLSITRSQKTAALTWTDPEDYSIDEEAITWDHSVLIRKADSEPQSIHDGEEIVVTTTRDTYRERPYIDSALELDVTYYYAVYSVTKEGVASTLSNIVSITIPTSRVMTVVIDQADSNPDTWATYVDDAIGMDSNIAIADFTESAFSRSRRRISPELRPGFGL